MRTDTFSVLIAGGGVAALEAALALQELGDDRLRVELLTAETKFWYRPVAVAEPFGRGEAARFDLGALAEAAGATHVLGRLTAVDLDRCEARTETGGTLAYDALLIACGAVPEAVVPGATTFRGPADTDRMRGLLDELARGEVTRAAFAVPSGSAWALPAYELVSMTAAQLAALGVRAELTLVTPEERPLEVFGRTASDTVRDLLDEAGIRFVAGASPVELRDGELRLASGDAVPAQRVVALPRLRGQRIEGVPRTADDFVLVDDQCCVVGTERVFAAGDITNFRVKQGGLAAQQAVAAAQAIAAYAGVAAEPEPFRPVLRGLLMTGSGTLYLRRDLVGDRVSEWASSAPIWWPATKIVGRRLAPLLASAAS